MALKKAVESNTGHTFEYWRIMPQVEVDFAEGIARGHLMVWANDKARKKALHPGHYHDLMTLEETRVVEEALVLSGQELRTALVTGDGDVRAALYVKLKALKFFLGAQDI